MAVSEGQAWQGRWLSRNELLVVIEMKTPEIIHLRCRCSTVTSRQSAIIEMIKKLGISGTGLAPES